MNRFLLKCFAGFIAIAFTIACSKKSDPTPATNTTTPGTTVPPGGGGTTTKTTQDYLVAHSWIVTAATSSVPIAYKKDGTASTDQYAQYDRCTDDDYTTYSTTASGSNKAGSFNSGTDVCAGWPQTINFSWTLNADQTVLTTYVGGGTAVYNIVSINDNTFIATMNKTDIYTNVAYTLTITYTAK